MNHLENRDYQDKLANTSLRLFFALWPEAEVRTALHDLQALTPGRHTRSEHLHMTLAFLGRQPAQLLPVLKTILATLPDTDAELRIDRLGYFRKNRIAWAGTHAAPESLTALHAALAQALEQHGIAFDRATRFRPHITLAREAEPPLEQAFEPFTWQLHQLALVESTQEAGRLAYRVLAMRKLSC